MIDVSAEQLNIILNILKQHVSGYEVRAFGSRHKWTAKDYSDLDLAVVGETKLDWKIISNLKEAFEESDLPFRVDVIDWHAISPKFRDVIDAGFEVIQKRLPVRGRTLAKGLDMRDKGWEMYKIGDIATVKGGKRLPKKASFAEHKTKHPYVRLVDIENGRISNKSIQYLDERIHSYVSRYIVETNDVCLAIVGHTIGKVFYVDSEWHGSNLTENAARLSGFKNADPKYVYYYLISNGGQNEIRRNMVGSAQGKLPIYGIQNIEIQLPPLPTQCRISSILSALDDKIELNRQTNQTLEAIAQAIFKEWFVDFRFPGSTGEMQDSELGQIPKGWRVGRLGEEGDFKNGINYSRDDNGDSEFAIVNVRNIVENKFLDKQTLDTIHIDKKKAQPYLLEADDILIVRSASPGESAILLQTERNIIYSGFTIRYRLNNKKYFLYLFYIFQNLKQSLDNLSNGTTLKNINQEMLRPYQVIIPDEDTIDLFNNIVESIFNEIQNTNQQSATLAAIRDALLPKLMNGDVCVETKEALL